MKEKRKLTLTQKRGLKGYLFILPWFIGFVIFYVRSLIMTVEFSFAKLTVPPGAGGYSLEGKGLENYLYAFRAHGSFKQTLTSSVGNMLIDVPLILFFSLFMALLLNQKFKGRGIVRAIFFLPVILNSDALKAAISLSEAMMNGGIATQAAEVSGAASSVLAFDLDYLINMFVNFGLPVKVLSYVTAAVGRINDIISASGVQIIIFIAALQSIPSSMYEVARIEGATAYETFWKVTLPLVMPHVITNMVYTIVDHFSCSDVVELAYSTAFTEFNYGLSAVFSIISTVITLLILALLVRMIQKHAFYYN